MNLTWTTITWEDYQYWQATDKKKVKRINQLIKATLREPFNGIGNPEALKHDLKGYWSHRIDIEHRLVYKLKKENLIIVACRYHY